MKESIELLSQAWPVFLSIVGLIAWLVRLESRVQSLNVDFEKLQSKHEMLDSKVMEQLAQMREQLARIEGALGVGAK